MGTQQRSGWHYAVKLLQGGDIGNIHTARMGSFRNVIPGFGTPPDSDPPRDRLSWQARQRAEELGMYLEVIVSLPQVIDAAEFELHVAAAR